MYNSKNKNKRKQYLRYLNQIRPFDTEIKANPNRKKIRNWPVLVKRLQALKNYYLSFDLGSLKEYLVNGSGSLYMKLEVYPFNMLNKRNLPLWYEKLFIQALIEVYNHWDKIAKNLGEEYYLKIWIFDPRFYESQVVLGIRDRISWYENIFDEYEEELDFPHERYRDSVNSIDTKCFSWEVMKSVTAHYKDDFLGVSSEYLKKKFDSGLAWEAKSKNQDSLIIIHDGDVWVGSRA